MSTNINGIAFKFSPGDNLAPALNRNKPGAKVIGFTTDGNGEWGYVISQSGQTEVVRRYSAERVWKIAAPTVEEAVEALSEEDCRTIVRALTHAVKHGTVKTNHGSALAWPSLDAIRATGVLDR